jgi:hypothetical protein
MAARGGLSEIAHDVVARRRDPWTIAEELLASM